MLVLSLSVPSRYPDVRFVVYTGDLGSAPDQILSRAGDRFNLDLSDPPGLPDRVEFVYLYRRPWVEARRYPAFTLLGQSLGSVVLGGVDVQGCF